MTLNTERLEFAVFTNSPHEAQLFIRSPLETLAPSVFTPIPKHLGFIAGRVLFGSGDPAGTVGIANYVSFERP